MLTISEEMRRIINDLDERRIQSSVARLRSSGTKVKNPFTITCDRIKATNERQRKNHFLRGELNVLWNIDKMPCEPITPK